MNTDLKMCSLYVLLIILQLAENFLPWIEYCTFEIFPSHALSKDLGLSRHDMSRKSYSTFRNDICTSRIYSGLGC